MGKHISQSARDKYVAWILKHQSDAGRAEAIRRVAKDTRHSLASVRRWVQIAKGPKMTHEPEVIGPVPTPDPLRVEVIPQASETERSAVSTESRPAVGAPDQDAAARAAQAAGAFVPVATINASGGDKPPPSIDTGGGAPPPSGAERQYSHDENVELVLKTFGGAKSGAVEFVLSKATPPIDPAKIDKVGQLSFPLREALIANADWLAPKIRSLTQKVGPWALAGAIVLDAGITFMLMTALLKEHKRQHAPDEKKEIK